MSICPTAFRLIADAHAQHVETFYEPILQFPIPKTPTRLAIERKRFRNKFLIEEQMEFKKAETLDEEADALVDTIIVALGGLIEMGIAPRAALEEVMGCNANKKSGKKPGRDSEGFDAMKPEGWLGPDYEALMSVGIDEIKLMHKEKKLLQAQMEKAKPTTGLQNPVAPVPFTNELDKALNLIAEAEDAGQAMKFNGHKTAMPELIPAPFLKALSELYAAGAIKYDAENWRRGRPWQDLVGSAERHFTDWRTGEMLDSESTATPQTHNLIAAAWNLITLYMYETQGMGTDNRPDVGVN